jgi:hypothetical protein
VANKTTRNPRSSPDRFAPIRPPAANGGHAAADAVADAAGAADRKTVWPDRLPTSSGRHRFRKRPARLPISIAIRRRKLLHRWRSPNPSLPHPRPNHKLPIMGSR